MMLLPRWLLEISGRSAEAFADRTVTTGFGTSAVVAGRRLERVCLSLAVERGSAEWLARRRREAMWC
ncbi:MAG: hypothetical protein VB036_07470, partial [Propionicimonas sp.]|nr:hypothetical protein [Propionicimonas sp.]